ncbi:MAG: hypothetical protein CSB55_05760 [Candidatus Cloacimonadota bacterium]|nr:MAG: hypothetical protein CSB55_05760 [Candidatus Cloacimonadota bacterium]
MVEKQSGIYFKYCNLTMFFILLRRQKNETRKTPDGNTCRDSLLSAFYLPRPPGDGWGAGFK